MSCRGATDKPFVHCWQGSIAQSRNLWREKELLFSWRHQMGLLVLGQPEAERFGCILFVGTSYQSHGFGTHHWNLNLWWGPQRNGSSGLPRLNLTESQLNEAIDGLTEM
ncbi:hypothetical protein MUK42_03170 [Musa troglodytarum]|uniref:Uncharacterized protein n=1 Tax=Musa troglodytarum TaxID=320322 RepID=A0A9E7FTC3_9LILI|nr:hypothetical protein MUK42_03170 [Musa troglodytarum]